jgi:hypothetical protein
LAAFDFRGGDRDQISTGVHRAGEPLVVSYVNQATKSLRIIPVHWEQVQRLCWSAGSAAEREIYEPLCLRQRVTRNIAIAGAEAAGPTIQAGLSEAEAAAGAIAALGLSIEK